MMKHNLPEGEYQYAGQTYKCNDRGTITRYSNLQPVTLAIGGVLQGGDMDIVHKIEIAGIARVYGLESVIIEDKEDCSPFKWTEDNCL